MIFQPPVPFTPEHLRSEPSLMAMSALTMPPSSSNLSPVIRFRESEVNSAVSAIVEEVASAPDVFAESYEPKLLDSQPSFGERCCPSLWTSCLSILMPCLWLCGPMNVHENEAVVLINCKQYAEVFLS
jgi:hypothetical protein